MSGTGKVCSAFLVDPPNPCTLTYPTGWHCSLITMKTAPLPGLSEEFQEIARDFDPVFGYFCAS